MADSAWFTHPILGKDANTPFSLFDDVTYNKGAVLLSMISKYMDGTQFIQNCNHFCTCLRKYLSAHAFSNANTSDLQSALGNTASVYMNSWLSEPGFPVVYVSIQSNHHEKVLFMHQRRFNVLNKFSKSVWNISIDLKLIKQEEDGSIKSIKTMSLILDRNNGSVSIPSGFDILVNAETTGFYYTHYGDQFSKMVYILSKNQRLFSDVEKAHFIYQAFQLSLSSQLPWTDAIKSLLIVKDEKSEVVWKTLLNLWFQLQGTLKNHHAFDVFQDTVRAMLPILGKSWPQSSIMVLGALSGSSEYIQTLNSIFYSWGTSRPIHVNPDYYEAVYHAALKVEANFAILWSSQSSYPGDTLKALTFSQFSSHEGRLYSYIQNNLSVSDRELYEILVVYKEHRIIPFYLNEIFSYFH